MNNATQASTRPRWTLPIIAIVVMIVFVALTLWGGAPRQQASLFAAGVALLIGVLLMYGLMVWYLLIRPLPAQLTIPQTAPFSVPQRRLMSVLLLVGGACLVVGGFWDEVWHRSFGFPFGPDLLWRPHLLIYASLLIPSILALVSAFRMIVNGEGAWPQRFRADQVLGFLTLTGALLVFIVPADPIWHTIYGADISAWSLPHIVLLFTVSVITLLAAAVELTTLPRRQWEAIWHIAAPDVLVLLPARSRWICRRRCWPPIGKTPMPSSAPVPIGCCRRSTSRWPRSWDHCPITRCVAGEPPRRSAC